MMRVVVDTNIIIRGLIKPLGPVGPMLTRLSAGEYTLVYSEPILIEILSKLTLPRIRIKYHIDDLVVENLLALIALRGELVVPSRKVKACRDPKHDMFIEAALAGAAPAVVTGDKDLLVLGKHETVRFMTPAEFLRKISRSET